MAVRGISIDVGATQSFTRFAAENWRHVSTGRTGKSIMEVAGGLEIQGSMRAADELRKRSSRSYRQAGRHKKRPALPLAGSIIGFGKAGSLKSEALYYHY
jgi:hypothetical protein